MSRLGDVAGIGRLEISRRDATLFGLSLVSDNSDLSDIPQILWLITASKAPSPSKDLGKERTKEEKNKVHVEAEGFDGDRVLANSILFLQDAGWWIEASYAIPEGGIGRAYEIMKSPKDLSDAILNNWLVNLTGELGKWIEADLMQEHYNRWLEDMAEKMGGEFDDKFYRHTLSPNVQHFLRIKEEIESAFELNSRSKTNGSAHLRDEFQSLLRMYREDELHRFRSARSMGHAAVNTFNLGYERLEGGRIKSFLKQSLSYSKILKNIKSHNKGESTEGGVQGMESGPQLVESVLDNDSSNKGGGDGSDGEDGDGAEEIDGFQKHDRPMPGQRMFIDTQSGSMIIEHMERDGNDSGSEEEEANDGGAGSENGSDSFDGEDSGLGQ
ncbi:hypothetical protein FPV67DRAFT_1657784 [Lyophyllum atratum]|nr:hypothetical protein FPV67DRAFT_1661352 [Lyophyllum atratum]KAF8057450.1 hypothetical protein FPV67DRAFT_1657784 [Lyophyllum atratum]